MAWLQGQPQQYEPPRMTNKQVVALEEFIAASSDASEFAKKVIIWALRKSQNLERPVALSVWDKDYGHELTKQVQDAAHAMGSSNGATHINLFLHGMGTEVILGHHCGCFEERDGDPFNSKAKGRTIWLSHVFYDRNVMVLKAPPIAELEAMMLPR